MGFRLALLTGLIGLRISKICCLWGTTGGLARFPIFGGVFGLGLGADPDDSFLEPTLATACFSAAERICSASGSVIVLL